MSVNRNKSAKKNKPTTPVAEPVAASAAEPVATPAAEPVVAPATPQPTSPEDRAKALNEKIDAGESSAAVLLWQLGGCLLEIKAQHPKWKWDDWKSYADSLGINASRFTRAIRIKRHFDSENRVVGKSIYDALGYARGDDEPVPEEKKPEYEAENAPLTSREDQAGKRFIMAVGGNLEPAAIKRAAIVLACIERGDKPVKKVGDRSWVPAWEEIKRDRKELAPIWAKAIFTVRSSRSIRTRTFQVIGT